jgi:uncharacterized membrane protein YdjX (TVP38/TMEM64 family)
LPAAVDALVVAVGAVDPRAAYLSAALAVIGSTIGCLILFLLARKGGRRFLETRLQTGHARRFRSWFRRYGLMTVFIPALLPIPLPTKALIITAGAFGAGVWPFLLVVLAARIPRYFGLAWLGSRVGENSMAWLWQHAWELAGITLVLCLLLWLLTRLAERGGAADVDCPP